MADAIVQTHNVAVTTVFVVYAASPELRCCGNFEPGDLK
jgi:hypothetical protein